MSQGVFAIDPKLVAIEPKTFVDYEQAVSQAGGVPTSMAPNVGALIWTDYSKPQALAQMLVENPQISWVQLPFAGVDAFDQVINDSVRFTSAKGSYREPVAEHALTLCLALGRIIPDRVRAKTWGNSFAVSLYDANVLIVGAGGITSELINLLKPFRSNVTVVRNQDGQVAGAQLTTRLPNLANELPKADFVVLACALTPETRGLFDNQMISNMKPEAYLVNIARGPVIVTDDLLSALAAGTLAGAAIDVTDPEPLPDGHPAWDEPKLLITPHTADTKVMVKRLFSIRLRENVAAYLGQGDWVGLVDPALGY